MKFKSWSVEMLGLVLMAGVIMGLWAWIYSTRLAMRIGGKVAAKCILNNPNAQKYGKWAGFMLFMGGWFIWWGIEFVLDWYTARRMCSQVGAHVYITPDEWKEMIGGEEVWRNIPDNYRSARDTETINWEGKEYKADYHLNDHLSGFSHREKKFYSTLDSSILYDRKLNKVLFKKSYHFHHIGHFGGLDINLSALKLWLYAVPNCSKGRIFPSPRYLFSEIKN